MSSSLRWGILSTAAIARNAMIPAIQKSSNGTVVAIASRDTERASATASALGIARSYGTYEELLADPEVDAVYNPLPASMHAEWTVKAAQAGKHVLCEKPLAPSAADARRMTEACLRHKRVLMEAFMYRFHPLTRRVVQMVAEGGVGTLKSVRASFSAPVRGDDDIRFKPELGGGAMLDVGCYCVNLIRLIAGEEPCAVSGAAHFGPSGVDETAVGTLAFPSGVMGHFGCSFRTQFDSSYDIVGTAGRILVDFGGMCHWPGAEFTIKHWTGDAYNEIVIAPANHYTLIAEEFAEAVLSGRQPVNGPEDSVRNLDVIDAVLASARAQSASVSRR